MKTENILQIYSFEFFNKHFWDLSILLKALQMLMPKYIWSEVAFQGSCVLFELNG